MGHLNALGGCVGHILKDCLFPKLRHPDTGHVPLDSKFGEEMGGVRFRDGLRERKG